MFFKDLNPRYIYVLLYIHKGGDPLYVTAKYGLILSELKELYDKYRELLDDQESRIGMLEELLRSGFSDEEISEAINWKDFERYVERYFNENGFKTRRNYRISRSRKEVDILAYRDNILFCIECKQWDKRISEGILKNIVKNHLGKCSSLLKEHDFSSYKVYPLIITLRYSKQIYIENVPILPIRGLREFLQKYYSLIIKGYLKSINELKLR